MVRIRTVILVTREALCEYQSLLLPLMQVEHRSFGRGVQTYVSP